MPRNPTPTADKPLAISDDAKFILGEIGKTRTELNAKIDGVRTELKFDIRVVEDKLDKLDAKIDRHLKWLVGLMVTMFVGLAFLILRGGW